MWKTPINIEELNQHSKNTLSGHLGIEYIEFSDDALIARMPVDDRTKQPIGLLNGGASCALAESVGSRAANYCVDQSTHYCVGLDISANHCRSARSGYVIATAKPLHLGNTTQVWEIRIEDDQNRLVCISRLTMMVMRREI